MTVLTSLGNIVIDIANSVIINFNSAWNYIASFANFVGNVFNDPLGAVARLWKECVTWIIDCLLSVTEIIDELFDTDWSSPLKEAKADVEAWAAQYGEGTVFVEARGFDEGTFDRINYDEAFDAGYYMAENAFGAGAADNSPFEFDYESLFSGPTGTADDPIHTNVDNDVNIADEDLQLLRDIAEARFVQNFVTLTPTVQVSGNTINEKADVNALIDEIEYRLETEIATSAEGVYG